MGSEILYEEEMVIGMSETTGPIHIRAVVIRDDVGYKVRLEGSLWQNPRSFKHVNVYSDEGNLEISARLEEAS